MAEEKIVYVERRNKSGCGVTFVVVILIVIAFLIGSSVLESMTGVGGSKVSDYSDADVIETCVMGANLVNKEAGYEISEAMLGGEKKTPNIYHCPLKLLTGERIVVIVERTCQEKFASRCYRRINLD
ncbi:hypothetical protein DES40_1751 [Litorimonas taeanensis]|uniref:Uncharacterized protein n=1 Tax=Litorimonas taeanensis TaxID=568099 RepID=A0A420WDE7_9PROT|nr:hypothetical protein [Litorimonas taeanensis]RKQ68975.1 hypothetical protein DES40_1751 [Litorimonas taeanensis]